MTSRVFANAPLVPGEVIELDPQESHYLVRVRRVRPGAAVEVFDGHVGGCSGTLLDASVGACRVRLEAALAFPDVPAIELGVALIDPKAALDVVARACEGGAVALTWLQTARSFNAAPSAARLERVLRAAQRQCGRPTPPRILGPVTLADWLAEATDRPTWFAAEHERLDPAAQATESKDASRGARLLIGPEGGWTSEESRRFHTSGVRPLSLGPWILRTEVAVTAGLARLWNREGGLIQAPRHAR